MKINVTCVTDGKNHPTITKSRTKKVNVINEIVIITMIIIIIIKQKTTIRPATIIQKKK